MTNPILITGGSSGIGAATARLASARGFPVGITYRSHGDAAHALVAELRAVGRQAHAFEADVSRDEDVLRLFAAFDVAFQGAALGSLVNSAGIGGPHGSIQSLTGEALTALWATNITGTILASREAIQRFDAQGIGGAIVNVSSMAATIGGRAGAAAYAASKAAVDTFTVGLAKEVAARGIRVNAVRPGLTATPMVAPVINHPYTLDAISATIPIGRPATADEIAKPILWLLSDEASFVTGARLDVSGGGFVVAGFQHASAQRAPTTPGSPSGHGGGQGHDCSACPGALRARES